MTSGTKSVVIKYAAYGSLAVVGLVRVTDVHKVNHTGRKHERK